MIRSCLLRGLALLVVSLPVLMGVAWLSNTLGNHPVHHVIITFQFGPGTYGVPSTESRLEQSHVVPTSTSRSVSDAVGTSVLGGPSLSPMLIDHVLQEASSPAYGTGQALYDLSQQYQIDDAYALAVFGEESSFGKAGFAVNTHGLGNIICAGYPTCDGRFRSYGSWQEGYIDFYRLLSTEYIPRGLATVEQIEPVYAPSNENDTALYIGNVERFMSAFRHQQATFA